MDVTGLTGVSIFLWWVASIVIFFFIVYVAVRVARIAWRSGEDRGGRIEALRILRMRYARGELTETEFEEAKRRLLD